MFRFLTAGESHGPCLSAIVEGIPAGLPVSTTVIDQDLARRQQGYGRGGRMLIETDRVEVLSGVRFGETLGGPIALRVNNRDWENWKERMSVSGTPAGEAVTAVRPGHADWSGVQKYDRKDVRDILERASARETAMRVAVGALAKALLGACGMEVTSRVINIGGVQMGAGAEEKVKERVDAARKAGDTLGGIFTVSISGAMPGLGSHIQWDRRLDARLAAAMISIQAIKGVEIGEGFGYADLPGSAAHDEIFLNEDGRAHRKTNHAGGVEGGMSNGETIIVRAVMKPIPTLMKPLSSIDIRTGQAVLASKERSDVCAVEAASVVGEAMAAIVMAEALLEKFGGDSLADLRAAIAHYQSRTDR